MSDLWVSVVLWVMGGIIMDKIRDYTIKIFEIKILLNLPRFLSVIV